MRSKLLLIYGNYQSRFSLMSLTRLSESLREGEEGPSHHDTAHRDSPRASENTLVLVAQLLPLDHMLP
jgi:hypothetical protein